MTTAIFLPAMRPQNFARIVENLAETTDDYHAYWVVNTPQAADELTRLKQSYWRDNGASWAVRLNHLYDHTTEPYFFLGADDLKWHPGWLKTAMAVMERIDGVVSVNDMWQHGVGTSALVSRNYIDTMSGCIDQPGVVCHPGYAHHGAETELFQTAAKRGRYAYCEQSVVEHMHAILGKAPDDEVYALGASLTAESVAMFESRKHLWR